MIRKAGWTPSQYFPPAIGDTRVIGPPLEIQVVRNDVADPIGRRFNAQ
jgi:hypothetical protein